jgi:SAM-dependent methyltransferase
MQPATDPRHPASYRDPSGFLFFHQGVLHRQVSRSYAASFEQLISSGLYQRLTEQGLMIPHEQIEENLSGAPDTFTTLRPEPVSMITYPYEWCFDMLKDAALLTLRLAREGMASGMMLKDASAYNIQWHQGRLVLIDSLSFEPYREQEPWIAYRQFCEHFLAPLALMHYRKMPLQPMLLAYPEGLPAAIASPLLPFRSRLHLHTYLHIHLYARVSQKKPMQGDAKSRTGFNPKKMNDLLRSLEEAVRSYKLDRPSGVWSGYYEEAGQREDYLLPKKELIAGWIKDLAPGTAVDAGANDGEFSALLAAQGAEVVSMDFDHYSIQELYRQTKENKEKKILPVIMDLSNPAPATGVNNLERSSLTARLDADLVLALALIHHLAIGKNIPFEKIAKQFRSWGRSLIIEFVPKDDPKIRLMLEQKPDVYDWYNEENFIKAFSEVYQVVKVEKVGGSGRKMFLMN